MEEPKDTNPKISFEEKVEKSLEQSKNLKGLFIKPDGTDTGLHTAAESQGITEALPSARIIPSGTERLRNLTYRRYQISGHPDTHDMAGLHEAVDNFARLGAGKVVILLKV